MGTDCVEMVVRHLLMKYRRRNTVTVPRRSRSVSMDQTDRTYAVAKTDEEWRAELSPAEYQVLRQAGTERPYVGEYTDTKTEGVYACRACGAELFTSDTKFDSHCGWPSFYSPLAGDSVEYIEDVTMGMKRVEVRCASCGSHLGHVFEGEGYGTPTDQRYCINSISLTMRPKA
jgi:peptide-methionine (R)-S-oxide reductase